jgi:osmotically-inducible protein OsmY
VVLICCTGALTLPSTTRLFARERNRNDGALVWSDKPLHVRLAEDEMSILRLLVLVTAVLIGGGYVVQYFSSEAYGLRWPARARAERALERARQRGVAITGKTAAAASKIVAKTEAAAIKIADKTSAAATRISDKTTAAATKIGEKTTTAADKIAEKSSVAAAKVEHTLSETAVSARIKAKMALDDNIKARAIDVSTHGTTVTLSGTVTSKAERARAVEVARQTAGVTRVVDELQIP